jgi:hypothetical protein
MKLGASWLKHWIGPTFPFVKDWVPLLFSFFLFLRGVFKSLLAILHKEVIFVVEVAFKQDMLVIQLL